MRQPWTEDTPGRTPAREGSAHWPILVVVAAGVLAAGLVFLYLWQGMILSQLRAERARTVLAVQELERVRLDLAYQVDRAYSLDEIARLATALGMVPFDEKRTRYLVIEGGNH